MSTAAATHDDHHEHHHAPTGLTRWLFRTCLLSTSDAADEQDTE